MVLSGIWRHLKYDFYNFLISANLQSVPDRLVDDHGSAIAGKWCSSAYIIYWQEAKETTQRYTMTWKIGVGEQHLVIRDGMILKLPCKNMGNIEHWTNKIQQSNEMSLPQYSKTMRWVYHKLTPGKSGLKICMGQNSIRNLVANKLIKTTQLKTAPESNSTKPHSEGQTLWGCR